jgi:3-methyl-2-oxobutanoate hydroxymethyltransferase
MFSSDYFRQFTEKPRGVYTALTAYDYPSSRLLDECGLDLILVGDSLGMMVLGHEDTTQVTLADMLHHTRAVARGASATPVVTDLPIGTYPDPSTAIVSARAALAAGADAVKLEGGIDVAETISALAAEQIPVLGHIGMLPQHVREEGGYKIKGRTPEQAAALRADALAVERAGAFAVVLELLSPPLAAEISNQLVIPTFGIGSGEGCDGQIRVLHDIIGLFPWFRPAFAQPKADVATTIQSAVREFIADVQR